MNRFDTSEYKITYLLGAGASAKALPTVKATDTTNGVSNTLKIFADSLKNFKANDNLLYQEYINNLILDLNWLAENSDKFGTTDTFAKFLYLQKRQELPRLKKTLSFYFSYEQFINKKIDERALIFLTSVMQIGNIFPTNIKILTWNYDFQIQIAAENFRKERFVINKGTVHSPPLINYYPSLGYEMNVNHDINESESFSLVHLNGIAGFYFDEKRNCILNSFYDSTPKDLTELIDKEIKDENKKQKLLTFAWETETNSSYFLRKKTNISKKIVDETDVLVIIGYSFPFFNRQIDKEIFASLLEKGKLKKIYYQDPYRSGSFLKKQFNLSDTIEIIDIKEVENYFIPNEL